MKGSPERVSARAAQLRHELLRVSTRAQAFEAGGTALRELLGLEPADTIDFVDPGQQGEIGRAHV